MRALFRTVLYFFQRITGNKTGPRRPYVFSVEKNEQTLKGSFQRPVGSAYHFVKVNQEKYRVWRYNQKRQSGDEKVIGDFLSYSKGILVGLILATASIGALDIVTNLFFNQLHIEKNVAEETYHTSQLILEIAVGAISALLGLIAALHAVSFQLISDKYSSDVSDYANDETVGNFFFKLLVFTDLFSLVVLLETHWLPVFPVIGLVFVGLLIVLSLLGILVYRRHYVNTSKPKSLFERIAGDIQQYIRTASESSRQEFNSWSIIQGVSANTRHRLRLFRQLFDDIDRLKNHQDIRFAPSAFSVVMVYYMSRKQYIDQGHGWWFPKKYKYVKMDDPSTTLELKLNYESQGVGPLHIEVPRESWFETEIKNVLKHAATTVDQSNDEPLLISIIEAYKDILAGDYAKDRLGRYQKTILGAYEIQDWESFFGFYEDFQKLYEKVSKSSEEVFTAYLNAHFSIGQVVLDGYDFEKLKKAITDLVVGGQLVKTEKQIKESELPRYFYSLLDDTFHKLEVEQETEGRVVTPQEQLAEEIITKAKKQEGDQRARFFELATSHQDEMIKSLAKEKKYESVAHFIKIRFEWMARLVYLEKYSEAEQLAKLAFRGSFYIVSLPREVVLEVELFEAVQKVLFPSVVYYRFELFNYVLPAFILTQVVLNTDENNADRRIERYRLIVLLGGLIYLVSEYRQSNAFLLKYTTNLEAYFHDEGALAKLVKVMGDAKKLGGLLMAQRLIGFEVRRYHHWFGIVIGEINSLPKKYEKVHPYYSGLQEVADHPSDFVKRMSSDLTFYEDDCVDAFVEWIEKREQVKELIKVLKKRL